MKAGSCPGPDLRGIALSWQLVTLFSLQQMLLAASEGHGEVLLPTKVKSSGLFLGGPLLTVFPTP